MKYKILYLEDQKADSLVADFRQFDIELIVDKAETINSTIDAMTNSSYDAFLMDYRLSQGKGSLNAPAFAGFLKTEDKRGKSVQAPVIMITNETSLHILNSKESDQDLFDIVMRKDDYNNNKEECVSRIISYIESYRKVKNCGFKLDDVLSLSKVDLKAFVDSRLLKELLYVKEEKNIFKYLRLLTKYLLSSPGSLINEDYLAARMGIDIKTSGDSWKVFLNKIESCKYTGVFSDFMKRWWMPKIDNWWKNLHPSISLRLSEAKERVDILNHDYNLTLTTAKVIDGCESTNFWAVCKALKRPIDPAEGYVCNDRYKMPWEENEFISAVGALEYPEYQKMLSDIDKKEVRNYGKKN